MKSLIDITCQNYGLRFDMQENLKNIAEDIFQKKTERRQALAKLSIEDKVLILIELQKLASEIRKLSHREGPAPWCLT